MNPPDFPSLEDHFHREVGGIYLDGGKGPAWKAGEKLFHLRIYPSSADAVLKIEFIETQRQREIKGSQKL